MSTADLSVAGRLAQVLAPYAAGAVCAGLDSRCFYTRGNSGVQAAMAEAVAEGTYLIAQPFHCAIGTKVGDVQ